MAADYWCTMTNDDSAWGVFASREIEDRLRVSNTSIALNNATGCSR